MQNYVNSYIFANNYHYFNYCIMKTKTPLLLFLIGFSFFSCNDTTKKSTTSDISSDFPTTEKLEIKFSNQLAIKSFDKYNISESGICVIDDSILWYVEDGKDNLGACYDLNTGKLLSVIASRGTAANEVNGLTGFKIVGDSILLHEGRNTIKTFAKKDILDNIPMEYRKVSVTTTPDSIWVSRMTKLPNGSVLATIRPPFEFEKEKINEINKKSVALFNTNKANSYETIKYDSFDVKAAKDKEIAANDLIKWTYAQGFVETKDNNTAVFSVSDQFILYTFDLNSGSVINEKIYTSPQRTREEMSFTTTNDMNLNIQAMKVNAKYILCKVGGYFSEEDKEAELQKEAIFVFDWDLNPLKKFELPDPEDKLGYYTISNDCNSIYFCEYNEEGITLYKADLNM